MSSRDALVETFMSPVEARNSGQTEFLQAVEEVAADVLTIEKAHSAYAAAKVLERLSEPDRIISFRVVWEDDNGDVQINRGWRVQTSNAIGPYKGGIRFHPTVNPSVLKFLGFEQVFKNALTGLPLGGGKGGSDFDPSGRSSREIMRFCYAFMSELSHHIGPDQDVPAGDINVGTREIGYLFGAYKRYAQQFHGAITGKGVSFGGSEMRIEATGYGVVFFTSCALAHHGDQIEGKRVAISGMGNVALHAARKANDLGATVVSLSNSKGTMRANDGLTHETINWIETEKAEGRSVTSAPSTQSGIMFDAGKKPWGLVEADIALPCATQNEIGKEEAKAAIDAGVGCLVEGANMPLTAEAVDVIEQAHVIYGPGKAANAGGVAISGIEMSQNAHRRFMTSDEVYNALQTIMQRIHDVAAQEGAGGKVTNYRRGANIAAYRKVADAVSAYGLI